MIVTRCVERLPWPSVERRQALAALPLGAAAFAGAYAECEMLQALEVTVPPRPAAPIAAAARVAFWNAERLKYAAPSARLLAGLGADAVLLAEVDIGMARSGNRHTMADLAAALGWGSVLGVEFVELGLGDARERAWHQGERNAAGLHGGGILSPHPLERPALIRLEASGRWFDGGFGERRIGGRIAVAGELLVVGLPVLLASIHYESHTGPADRLAQTRALLDAIDAHAPGRPVLLGGDFNTSSFELWEKDDRDLVAAALRQDARRLVDPTPFEPMFAHLAERGYGWSACNVPEAPTQRTRPDGTPSPPFGKIDWLFARGLRCDDPALVAAVDASGSAISDHEVLAVTIAPAAVG